MDAKRIDHPEWARYLQGHQHGRVEHFYDGSRQGCLLDKVMKDGERVGGALSIN